jgi:hypothetical protein
MRNLVVIHDDPLEVVLERDEQIVCWAVNAPDGCAYVGTSHLDVLCIGLSGAQVWAPQASDP